MSENGPYKHMYLNTWSLGGGLFKKDLEAWSWESVTRDGFEVHRSTPHPGFLPLLPIWKYDINSQLLVEWYACLLVSMFPTTVMKDSPSETVKKVSH